MGLFEKKIKPGADLSKFPTDRLLREYEATRTAIAYINQANAAAEFATRDNPVVVDAASLLESVNKTVIHQQVKAELVKRGLIQPD